MSALLVRVGLGCVGVVDGGGGVLWVVLVRGWCWVSWVVWCRWWCRVGVWGRCVVRRGGWGVCWRVVWVVGLVDVGFSLAWGVRCLEDRAVVLGGGREGLLGGWVLWWVG